jgi:hypothetical protein
MCCSLHDTIDRAQAGGLGQLSIFFLCKWVRGGKQPEGAVSVGACGSMDSALTGAPVARICVLSNFVACDSSPST